MNDFEVLKNKMAQGPFKCDISLETDLKFTDGIQLSFPLGLDNNTFTCFPYSGTFNGNGHIIRNLKMDNAAHAKYSKASLFCELKDATIKDVVLADSCVFSGASAAAAIALSVSGTATLQKVTNAATVYGTALAGGYVASFANAPRKSRFHAEDCLNKVAVHSSATGDESSVLATYIGAVSGCDSCSVVIQNTENDALVNAHNNGEELLGGCIGLVEKSNHFTVTIAKNKFTFAINDFTQTKNAVHVGGVIALLRSSSDFDIDVNNNLFNYTFLFHKTNVDAGGVVGSISQCSGGVCSVKNNKNCPDPCDSRKREFLEGGTDQILIISAGGKGTTMNLGGLIGSILEDPSLKVTVQDHSESFSVFCNFTSRPGGSSFGSLFGLVRGLNGGAIHVERVYNVGALGLVGAAGTPEQSHTAGIVGLIEDSSNLRAGEAPVVKVTDCYRFQGITPAGGMTCGMVCSNSKTAKIFISNSVAGTNLEGDEVYGIANQLYSADNLPIYFITKAKVRYTFWKKHSGPTTNIYGSSGECYNCEDSVVLFEKDGDFYRTVDEPHDRVDDLLNKRVEEKGYSLKWNKLLELEFCSK